MKYNQYKQQLRNITKYFFLNLFNLTLQNR